MIQISEHALRKYAAGAVAQMLPEGEQRQMEALFGADFSDVRIIVSRAPDHVDARAFTSGREIHVGRGYYHPTTRCGKALIAHELTHVQQQREGRATGSGSGVAVVYDLALEREAEWMALRALRGNGAPPLPPRTPQRDSPSSNFGRGGAALQPLRLSRFEGWSRLIN